jgi:hypothetical protein
VWTLDASSFFVQAAPELSASRVTVSSLQLVTGTLDVLTPLQTTPLTVGQVVGIGAGTVNHSGDVSFVGDASGNWRLQGIVSMSGFGFSSGNGLRFGITASANDANVSTVPEPTTSILLGLGLVGIALRGRSQARRSAA